MTKRAEQFVTRVQFTTDELSRLLARRRRARLGCTALARQLGVTVTAMDNYERGIRRVPVALLPRWSRALDESEHHDTIFSRSLGIARNNRSLLSKADRGPSCRPSFVST